MCEYEGKKIGLSKRVYSFIRDLRVIILTKFDGSWTRIMDFLLEVYFWANDLFQNQ